jgi:hypothetical protein
MQKVMSVAPSTLDDLADDTDGNDNDTDNNDTEMEELRKTVKGKPLCLLTTLITTHINCVLFICRAYSRSVETTSRIK